TEKAIASGISARATTRPARVSVRRRRGERRTLRTELSVVTGLPSRTHGGTGSIYDPARSGSSGAGGRSHDQAGHAGTARHLAGCCGRQHAARRHGQVAVVGAVTGREDPGHVRTSEEVDLDRATGVTRHAQLLGVRGSGSERGRHEEAVQEGGRAVVVGGQQGAVLLCDGSHVSDLDDFGGNRLEDQAQVGRAGAGEQTDPSTRQLVAVAEGAVVDQPTPQVSDSVDLGQLVAYAGGQDDAAGVDAYAGGCLCDEPVAVVERPHRAYGVVEGRGGGQRGELAAGLLAKRGGRRAVVGEEIVHVGRGRVARLTGVDEEDSAVHAGQRQRGL